jgi:hypothetical protein
MGAYPRDQRVAEEPARRNTKGRRTEVGRVTTELEAAFMKCVIRYLPRLTKAVESLDALLRETTAEPEPKAVQHKQRDVVTVELPEEVPADAR